MRKIRQSIAVVVAVVLLGQVVAVLAPPPAWAQGSLAIVEVVASSDSNPDAFGDTSDWIEIQNFGPAIDTTGWSIADNGDVWPLPTRIVTAGSRFIIRASSRNIVVGNEFHSNFRLSASVGETLTLAGPTGQAVSTLTFPPLDPDQSYGRAANGEIGFLAQATFNAANSGLALPIVSIDTESQAFINTLDVALTSNAGTIRYTTDGSPVDSSSPIYNGPLTISLSTVLRAAVVDRGTPGPESSAAYIAITSGMSGASSDLPLVLIQKTTGSNLNETTLRPTIMSVVEPGPDGRTTALGAVNYLGFAGMRIRGASSVEFPKKQYKVELWSDPDGTEIRRDLLGMGADGDWNLYAPGRLDRAMINNPLMYSLGKELGVAAPDSRFVEVYYESDPGQPVGIGDYAGLYLLRETIEIAPSRVDITKHTDTSSGGAGGYIVGYDWDDSCCYNIAQHPDYGSRIVSKDPGAEATGGQKAWIDGRWSAIQSAAANEDYGTASTLVDFDSIIDQWLLLMLSKEIDSLRASHFMHLDRGGQLKGGPIWDFDRALGSDDWRVDDLYDAEPRMNFYQGNSARALELYKWSTRGGSLIESDIYKGFWEMPEVQAQLRARWAELRTGLFSDASLGARIDSLGSEITEAYGREITVWNDSYRGGSVDNNNNGARLDSNYPIYGSRFGDLGGELSHMKQWLGVRTAWLDNELTTNNNPPSVQNPGTVVVAENVPANLQIAASGANTLFYDITGLPLGLNMSADGLINGTVAYGDSGTFPVVLTVTTPSGAATAINFTIEVLPLFDGSPKVILNEYNAVEPGLPLAFGGTDATLGSVGGNGGDWFEIVTLEDELDMRGWSFELWSNDVNGVMTQNAELVLGSDPVLEQIRAGSIVTVAEAIADDLSYAPQADDWTLNLQANGAGAGAAFATQTNFDTNRAKWRLVVRDSNGAPVAPVAGETEPWDIANGGVSGSEVFALNANPSASVSPTSDYVDTNQSTFGLPNLVVPAGQVNGNPQDFTALRPELAPTGDVNCDGKLNIVDAYAVARFAVELATDVGGCPVSDITEIHAAAGDFSDDGITNILDASLIARCVVQLPEPYCPAEGS